MAKTKISEWSTTPASNTDIDGINIAEGCAPSGINDAIRDLMSQVRSWQSGASGDPFNGPMNGTIGATTAYSGAFTTVSATGVITSTLATGTAPLTIASTTKVTNLNADLLDGADWASPAALGSTTPAAVSATTLSASGTVSGTGFSNYLASPPAIGGTTAAAGNFTTLTTSSTVTLNGGTANGVTYLNGSKVLTSGSALTFDGTNFAVGSNAPGQKFVVNGASGVAMQLENSSDSNRGGRFVASGSAASGTFAVNTTSSGYTLTFGIDSNEQMRLTSTGLGIGTSSPAYKLQVVGGNATGFLLDNGGQQYTQLLLQRGGTANTGGDILIDGSAGTFNIRSLLAGPMEFYTSSTAGSPVSRLRLDSAGNLGLGVTPSAWSAGKAYEVGAVGTALWSNSSVDAYYTQGAYFNAGWKYSHTGATGVSNYQQSQGKHTWSTAAGGTAGNTISFTQAMTLDASGNLRIGLTSVAYNTERITVYKSGNVESAAFINDAGVNNYTVAVSNRATTGDNKFMVFATESSDTTRGTIAYNRGTGLVVYSTTSDYRAKDIIGPVENPGAVIDAVPVYMGKMKGATQERPMFIAHETPAYAHTGEKDAVDADGNPVYQQMDASALIPVMWAEIQSLRQRLAAANL